MQPVNMLSKPKEDMMSDTFYCPNNFPRLQVQQSRGQSLLWRDARVDMLQEVNWKRHTQWYTRFLPVLFFCRFAFFKKYEFVQLVDWSQINWPPSPFVPRVLQVEGYSSQFERIEFLPREHSWAEVEAKAFSHHSLLSSLLEIFPIVSSTNKSSFLRYLLQC